MLHEPIRPQSRPQELFLTSEADIVIYGGAAGGGKTWGLLMNPLYYVGLPGFNALFLRRTYPQILNPGGLFDEASRLYMGMAYKPTLNKTMLQWTYPSGAYIRLANLQYEDSIYQYQGAQIPLICFDELTHFTEKQFFYMLSRNRSIAGIQGGIRAGTNPDASSWVKKLLAPWVDGKWVGKPAQPGEHRHFIRQNDVITWVDADYLGPEIPGMGPESRERPKSLTYIPASVFDNKKLLAADPGYLHNLYALPYIEKRRLLFGDWDILPAAGKVIRREKLRLLEQAPHLQGATVRFWDMAATEKTAKKAEPDYTVGVKMMKVGTQFYVLDVIAVQLAPAQVEDLMYETAKEDGQHVAVRWEVEGGSSGKYTAWGLANRLAAFDAQGQRPMGDKLQRSKAFASAVEAGNMHVVNAGWTEAYLTELHHFPDWAKDDRVDATSGAYNHLIADANAWGDDTIRQALADEGRDQDQFLAMLNGKYT